VSRSADAISGSSIYDLGYRRYEGGRLGRRHAVLTLYFYSLRTAFGFGRGAVAKIVPIGLTLLVLVPALIQLAVAAVASNEIEVYTAHGYYGYVQALLVLFVAVAAPDLVGRDQRNNTLSLYFSRPLLRSDYALTKLAALTSAMLFLTWAPQLVLFIGSILSENGTDYLEDNYQDLLPIAASGLLISLMLASIALAIAAYVPRRAFATSLIIGLFVVSSIVAASIVESSDADWPGYAMLAGGYQVMRGFTFWFFNVPPGEDDPEIAKANLNGAWYFLAACAYVIVSAWLLVRRFERLRA
jgi:ABC-2 type transport system permease protein